MQPMQIKALELEQSVFKFLDGVIADYGVYIFMGLVFLLILIFTGCVTQQHKSSRLNAVTSKQTVPALN